MSPTYLTYYTLYSAYYVLFYYSISSCHWYWEMMQLGPWCQRSRAGCWRSRANLFLSWITFGDDKNAQLHINCFISIRVDFTTMQHCCASHSALRGKIDEIATCLSDDGHSAHCMIAKYIAPCGDYVSLIPGEDKNLLPLP